MMIKPHSDVKMANYLVENRPKMNVDETRLFLTMVASVNKDDIELNTLKIPVSEFAELWGLDPDGAYSRLKEALRGLRGKEFFVEGINPTTGRKRFLSTSYITTAAYEQGYAYATAKISDEFKPYLLALKACYTSYVLENVMQLDTVNAIRNYELLKQYQSLGQRTFSVAEYKQLLRLEGKYSLNADLRRYVIDPAVNEINANTDIQVSYEFIGRGQRAKLKFTIQQKAAIREELEGQTSMEDLPAPPEDPHDRIPFLSTAVGDEFSREQMLALMAAMIGKYPSDPTGEEHAAWNYLRQMYTKMNTRKIKQSRFGYLLTMIENDGE